MSKITKFVFLFIFTLALAGASMASTVYTVLCVVNSAGYGLPAHSFMDGDNNRFNLTWKTTPAVPPSNALADASVTILDSNSSSSKTLPLTDKFGRTVPFLAYAGDWIYVQKANYISQAFFQIPSDPDKINEDRLIARVSLKPIPTQVYPIKILAPNSSN